MTITNLFDRVYEVNTDRGYWFVRTDSGRNFNTFYEHNFIGIGWNYITLEDLTTLSPRDIILKIAKIENLDLSLQKSKSAVTSIYHKLLRFKELKKGDIVVIPSYSSGRYAFGIIEDTNVYVDSEKSFDCDYYKRKKVKWVLMKPLDNLPSIFYKIKISRHSISNIKEYEEHIDKLLNNLYLKDGNANFVIEVKKEKNVNVDDLLILISAIKTLQNRANEYYNLNEDISESYIKIDIQSPGDIQFQQKLGRSLIIAASALSMYGCSVDSNSTHYNSNNNFNKPVDAKFVEINKDTLDSAHKALSRVKANQEKINSINDGI